MSSFIHQWSCRFYRITNNGSQLDVTSTKLEPATRDARHIKQIVDEPYHMLCLSLHHGAELVDCLAIVGREFQQFQAHGNGGQRVTQFVRKSGQNLVLSLVGISQRALRTSALRLVSKNQDRS